MSQPTLMLGMLLCTLEIHTACSGFERKKKTTKIWGLKGLEERSWKWKLKMTYHIASCHRRCFAQAFYIDLSLRHCSNCSPLSPSIASQYSQAGRFKMCYIHAHPQTYSPLQSCLDVFVSHAHTLWHIPALPHTHAAFLHAVESFSPSQRWGNR